MSRQMNRLSQPPVRFTPGTTAAVPEFVSNKMRLLPSWLGLIYPVGVESNPGQMGGPMGGEGAWYRDMTKGERLAAEANAKLMLSYLLGVQEIIDQGQFHEGLLPRFQGILQSAKELKKLYEERLKYGKVRISEANVFNETLEEMLLRQCKFRGNAPPGTGKDIGEVEAKRTVQHPPCTDPAKFTLEEGIVSPTSCQKLIKIIDDCAGFGEDVKFELKWFLFLTQDEQTKITALLSNHGFIWGTGELKFIARKWTVFPGEKKKGINKHYDHHQKVLQIPLNTDFTGGELVYEGSDGEHHFTRRTGMAIIHGNSVLHWVTPLVQGTRYSVYCVM